MGRRDSLIVSIYREQCKQSEQRKADNVLVTLFRGLSLPEYKRARSVHCRSVHVQPCLECDAMISVVCYILMNGHCPLSQAFKLACPGKEYKADIALRRLLQMPLAAVRVGTALSGRAAWFLVAYVEGV